MKKIILLITIISSFVFASDINLSGEFAKELGNPFKVLLEKKDTEITINSKSKEVSLLVKSNLNKSIYNKYTKNRLTLNNKSLENVMSTYYGEEYKVKPSENAKVKLNIKEGFVELDYTDFENSNTEVLNKIIVTLTYEIEYDGKVYTKKVSLDNTLGKEGKNYSWSITISDFKNINLKTINTTITQIIEVMTYNTLKEIK